MKVHTKRISQTINLTDTTTLFEKLGGYQSIVMLVEGMYAKIFNDPEIATFFRKTDKHHQIDKMA